MRRRLTRGQGSDSLELLLDTLANVFGGIILIACLLAILPRHTMPPPLMRADEAASEMIERRIAAAEEELGRLEDRVAERRSSTDPALAKLLAERDSLESTRKSLSAGVNEGMAAELDAASARALAATSDPGTLETALDELRALIAEAETVGRATSEKIEFLEGRLAKLADEMEELEGGKANQIRFPRERGENRFPFPVILTNKAIYPLLKGEALQPNPAVGRREIPGEDAFVAMPRADRGFSLPGSREALLKTLKRAKARGLYVSVYIYPDSHAVFDDLKAVMFEVGIRYGIEFVEDGRSLMFGEGGSAPPDL